MKKLCPKCNLEKDELEYTASQFAVNFGRCRSCNRLHNAEYYQKNRDVIISKVQIRAQNRINEVSLYQKEYNETNKDKVAALKQKRYMANKNEINHQSNEYQKLRRQNDPEYKLRKYMSSYIGLALRRNGSSKNGNSILDFLPYTIEELKLHLEAQFDPWMNWGNQGSYNIETWDDQVPSTWAWQIDHIISQADLLYSSMNDNNFQKCWALNNLRPLSAKQNIIDGRRKL